MHLERGTKKKKQKSSCIKDLLESSDHWKEDVSAVCFYGATGYSLFLRYNFPLSIINVIMLCPLIF